MGLVLLITQPRPTGRYDSKPRQMAHYHALLDRLRRIPGIQAIAVVNNPPLTNVNTAVTILGPDGQPKSVPTRTVSPQYFAAMGIPVVAGRVFSEADQAGAPWVAILNQTLARELFPGRDPVGQILADPGAGGPVTVVGVVRDSPQMSYERPAEGELYHSYQQNIFGVFMSTIVVRTAGEPLSLAATLRKAVWEVDPNQPIVKVQTMTDAIRGCHLAPPFFRMGVYRAWRAGINSHLRRGLRCGCLHDYPQSARGWDPGSVRGDSEAGSCYSLAWGTGAPGSGPCGWSGCRPAPVAFSGELALRNQRRRPGGLPGSGRVTVGNRSDGERAPRVAGGGWRSPPSLANVGGCKRWRWVDLPGP